jgi:hypothetical protein
MGKGLSTLEKWFGGKDKAQLTVPGAAVKNWVAY